MVGQQVRFHPIIGGKHDGRVWIIEGHCLTGGKVRYWLGGKFGYVSEEALSSYVPARPGKRMTDAAAEDEQE
jgi:hypothetical protein